MGVDLNHVVLIGRLTRDAELKYTANGQAVCKFSIAVNRRRKTGDQWVEEVSFFDIVVWGRMGESLNQYLIKGKMVAIDGELRQDRWEQDGQNRSKVDVVANNIQLLGGNPNQSGGGGANPPPSAPNPYQERRNEGGYQPPPPAQPREPQNGGDNFTDDIPF
ncbi:MAG: single-stranded DNA-binding protein [Treponema sp.]|jgi:single-strand DNA-binding protein|nr:single-stranded DNA-binding protein [Treponema sp.]